MEIFNDLSWLVYGILIGLFVPLIFLIGNKQFGISSSLQNICLTVFPKSKKVFPDYNTDTNKWKLFFVLGIVAGGFLAANIFSSEPNQFLPDHYYSVKGIFTLLLGGFLVGFGTRYANGCTSGHAITGLSMLKLSSLIATVSFFVVGLLLTFFNSF